MKFPILAMSLLLPISALAHGYAWLDGGLVDANSPQQRNDLGVRLSGSAELTPPVALFGEIVDVGSYTHLTAGAMYHTRIDSRLDFHAGGALELVDTEREDDTGLGLYAGLRWQVPTGGVRLELSPELRHLYVLDRPSTSLRNNLLLRIAPRLDLQGALQVGDEDRIELGARYTFDAYPARAPF